MQFSIHTTDESLRDEVIPVKKWDFARIAEYGARFYEEGDRKVTLNFALAKDMPVDPGVLVRYFDPQIYLIKITPLNPTHRARDYGLTSYIDAASREDDRYDLVDALREAGYRVIVSIGEPEENYIGSNCGQYVLKHLDAVGQIPNGYTYPLNEIGTQY